MAVLEEDGRFEPFRLWLCNLSSLDIVYDQKSACVMRMRVGCDNFVKGWKIHLSNVLKFCLLEIVSHLRLSER